MIKIFGRFCLRLLIVSVPAALIHWVLVGILSVPLPREEIFGMHLFLVVLTLLVFLVLNLVWKKGFSFVGFAFLALVIVKMAVSLAYLIPLTEPVSGYGQGVVLHFMAAYFLYLFVETWEVLKLMRRQPSKPSDAEEK